MEVIPQEWVVSTKTDGFVITKYKILNPYSNKPAEWIKADNFIRIHGYETGKPGSTLSPVAPLKNILKEQINSWTFRNQVWDKGGRVTAYLARPADAGEWTPEQRDRFVKAWKEKYSGNKAPDAGGMPLLEDGMEIKGTAFNAHETEWSKALTLSRESVAAIYHVNPNMVWASEKSTYASAKENARSLYVDCLGTKLEQIAQALNRFLLPKIGADEKTYVEFDIRIKLSGSFEEQSDVMVRATGTAYQTINETRALMNLPRLDDPDADTIIKPLNVLFGGQASPLTPTENGGDAAKGQVQAIKSQETASMSNPTGDNDEGVVSAQKAENDGLESARTIQIKGAASTDDVLAVSGVFRKYFKRQRKSVLSEIDRSRDRDTLHDATEDGGRVWYDTDRWNKELAEDLVAKLKEITPNNVQSVLTDVFDDLENYNEEYIDEYLASYGEFIASKINDSTLRELIRAIDDPESFTDKDAVKSTPVGVFDYAEEMRADMQGQSVATNIKGWANIAAVHMSGKQKQTMKTWKVTSVNPRSEHAKIDGETIPYVNKDWAPSGDPDHGKPGRGEHNYFSNGLRWPGDFNSNVKQVAGCKCELELSVTF